jgi:hypothetical protein
MGFFTKPWTSGLFAFDGPDSGNAAQTNFPPA